MSGAFQVPSGDELWQDWLDGELPEDQHEALAGALGSDEARSRAVDFYQTHRLLGLVHGDDGERFVRATVGRLPASGKRFSDEVMAHLDQLRPWRRWPGYTSLAAAAVLLVAVGLGSWLALQPPPAPVATLVTAQDARWHGLQPRVGDRLRPGSYQLAEGRVLIHGDGGAQLAVIAPAQFSLQTRERLGMLGGTIALRLDADSHGFTVATALGDFVDHGTEFVLLAGQATEVHVIAGRVACVRRDTPTAELVAGQALRLHAAGEAGEVIPLGALDFDTALPAAVAATAAAGLGAYDGFAYRPQDDTLRDGGHGWSGAWQRGVPGRDGEAVTVLAQGLATDGQSVSGRALELSGVHQTVLKRTLAEPLPPVLHGTRYLSFLYRLDQAAAERSAQPEDDLRVALVSGDDGERAALGLRAGHPWLAGVGETSPLTVAPGQLQRVVLRLATQADGSEETALLMVPADAPLGAEPTEWTITSALQRRTSALIRLEIGFAPGSRAVLDEVRLATTWAAAVGMATPP